MCKIIVLFSLLLSPIAQALITIDKGTYTVPAMIYKDENGPIAIFNFGSNSECRLKLKGKKTEKIKMKFLTLLNIKIDVEKRIKGCVTGEADLISFSDLKEDLNNEKKWVGNNLIPLKK